MPKFHITCATLIVMCWTKMYFMYFMVQTIKDPMIAVTARPGTWSMHEWNILFGKYKHCPCVSRYFVMGFKVTYMYISNSLSKCNGPGTQRSFSTCTKVRSFKFLSPLPFDISISYILCLVNTCIIRTFFCYGLDHTARTHPTPVNPNLCHSASNLGHPTPKQPIPVLGLYSHHIKNTKAVTQCNFTI